MMGFTEAYRKAGYVLSNPRNDWSAVKPDGSSVALTVWQDEIVKNGGAMFMDLREHPALKEWKDRQGNRQRIKHIQYGLATCGGNFDVILCRAVDTNASPRKVAHAEPWVRLRGHIKPEEFNSVDGTFRIEFRPA